jgi:hypothetical protein
MLMKVAARKMTPRNPNSKAVVKKSAEVLRAGERSWA